MVQTLNFINLSSQQAPNDVDWAGLVNSGVQGVLIRLGHGIIRDPCASGHIAKAKQYGLYWHGYHTYEGVVNEPQFTIKNATELGLSTSQYYFADLTQSSDPFNDYYALHATWLSQGYSTGLLISNEDYLSKFKDSEVIASGTLRWLISDTKPADYDVWQYSSEGTVGTSSVKVGFNFAKTDKLKYNLNTTLTGADINKDPYNPETPVGGAYIGWGYDTTGLGGGKTFGYSTNGKNFYALVGPDGLIVRKNDGNRIYGTIADQIDSAISANVIPAKSAADSAVSAADAAVASAQVTSDAVSAIASATAEAKQGANDAMSRALSAWDVATGAKEAVTDFDPLVKSAQSDAGKALAQIADTASALSDAKTVFTSDVAVAKNLANVAQTTANNAVESAGENARALTSQANALSDAKKAMDSDIASAKGLANAAQATADSAIKSASSVASGLTAVASQAKSNASGITKVTSDVGLLQTTVADNSGNISTIQETTKQIQQAVSDNSGAIVVATQTAQSATTVASNAKSNATVAVQTASGASVTAKNAQGDATTAITTAKGAVTQASDAKSNATIAVQTASEASLTAANAKGDASVAKQTASDASVQIKNAQGDISALQTRAGKIEASVANNSGAIANVQITANQLKASVSDNAGNITVAKQTAQGAVTVASDASSNATVANQTASQASITANNASGQAASAVLTANGAMATASDAKSDATVAVQTASGASLTVTNANSDATIAKQTASEAKVEASNANSDFAQLSIRANKIEANVANNSGAIASVQQTANGLTTTVADIKANGGGRNLLVGTSTVSGDVAYGSGIIAKGAFNGYDAVKTNGAWVERFINLQSALGRTDAKVGDWYTISVYVKADQQIDTGSLVPCRVLGDVDANTNDGFLPSISMHDKPITTQWQQYSWSFQLNDISLQRQNSRIEYSLDTGGNWIYWAGWMLEKGVVTHDWSPAPDDLQNQFTQIKTSINGVATIINDPKTGLNATYQTATGNATTISNVKGDVAQLQTTANGLTSRVGNLESKTNTQQTTIDQNKKAIALKADQTDVNTLKGTVSQNSATLKTQASQIQAKVSASDVTGMLNGYATQSYAQSLVTQTADDWNVNLTKLKNGTQTSLTNLAIGVEGVQAQVYNSDGSSKITQLSNLIATKVSQGDYNSQITQLKNDINLRVTKGDLISQINLEAGTALIQSNKIVLDAGTTVFTGDAFIPAAAIAELDADKLTFYGNGSKATIGASVAQYDDDKQKSTINLQYNGGIEIHSSNQQGSILTMHDNTIRLASKSWGDNPNAYQYSGFYAAPNYSLMNTYHKDGTTSGVAIDDDRIHIYGSSKDQQLGALKADIGWYSINGKTGLLTGNQIALKSANTQVTLTDRNINIENTIDTNSKNYDVAIHIKGWAEMTGWFTCMGITQTSLLSTKTRIEPLDTKVALDKIVSANVNTYQFKTDVAKGKTKRHASVIIDDVHDVAEYCTPEEFISEDRKGRDDGDIIGYLMGAVQELTKRIKTLEEKTK
ncbi:hypothetical protein LHV02_00260 [Limosilactobacillus fermentum]|uniref:gp58-like family protein n=6 Tax=Bacteria TaxID=2 RepID=UPI0016581CFF|nr:gp58-like family protein [Limosilactobacillus fermentum]MBC9021174.1 hypothetical protein [Limosilactobacillus fermentum CECT 5716]MCH5396609.1 hypothetical protein [Limosilactobacillus fermentum]